MLIFEACYRVASLTGNDYFGIAEAGKNLAERQVDVVQLCLILKTLEIRDEYRSDSCHLISDFYIPY